MEREEEGLRWLVSVNADSCGAKTAEICSVCGGMLAIGFFSRETAGSVCREGHLELWSFLLCGCYSQALVFFFVPNCLCLSFPNLGGGKLKQDLHAVLVKLVAHPTLPLEGKELFLSVGVVSRH